MTTRLIDIYEGISPPSKKKPNKPLYSVIPVPSHSRYFVGKDIESLACLLVSTSGMESKPLPPIRLESLDAQFALRCHFKKENEPGKVGIFTVIRCRDSNNEMIHYFMYICEMILRVLGDRPTQVQITTAVSRLAAIFQRIRQPSTRSLNGLFGELYILLRSKNATKALAAWRINENARFDFSDGDVRIDVKAAGGRSRQHTFSYEQCNPPPGTIAIVASLFAEQAAGGASLYSIINQIEASVSPHADLVFKLHDTVAATLGANLNDCMSRCFDMRLAESSLQFFDLVNIPAIRGPLPVSVSEVHFRSDLSALSPVSIETLIDRDTKFSDLLPKGDELA